MVMSKKGSKQRNYVLMTAAHNEELHIEKTLLSVTSQTILPERWVIISDNSRDRTDEIVQSYADRYTFIRFLRIDRPKGRSFGAKVLALHEAVKLLGGVTYDFIGNLDADISLRPDYFQRLFSKFEQDSALGITGGFVYEENEGKFASRRINSTRDVAHAAQLVRRECYEEIGGYKVLEYGGEDWYAQTCARMKGWAVQAFPELHIFHHRHTGEGSRLLANHIRLGRLDYSFGSNLTFEFLKCFRRMREKPYVLGASIRLFTFCWRSIRKKPRSVPDEFIAFLRKEQRVRVASLSLWRYRNSAVQSGERVRTTVQLH
jgi:poly-beta-1,6-N-acetyl-D-glucosamine synthase